MEICPFCDTEQTKASAICEGCGRNIFSFKKRYQIPPVWTIKDIFAVYGVYFFFAVGFQIILGFGLFGFQVEEKWQVFLSLLASDLGEIFLVWIIYLYIKNFYSEKFLVDLRLRSFHLGHLIWIVGFVVIYYFFVNFIPKLDVTPPLMSKIASSHPATLLYLADSILIAPFCEELFWRGFLYPVLKKSTGFFGAIVLGSVLFAMMHLPNVLPAVERVSIFFSIAVVLTFAREITDSTWSSIVLHTLFNATVIMKHF